MSVPDGAVDRRSGLERRIHTEETRHRFTGSKRGMEVERRRYDEGSSSYLLAPSFTTFDDLVAHIAYVDRRAPSGRVKTRWL